MNTAQDYTKMMQDMMGQFPMDMSSFHDAFRTSAELNGKIARLALEAAEKSTEISSKWTKETIERLARVSDAASDPADYAKAVSEFAATQAELAGENLAALAEVAQKAHSESVSLMLSVGDVLGGKAKPAQKAAKAAKAK